MRGSDLPISNEGEQKANYVVKHTENKNDQK